MEREEREEVERASRRATKKAVQEGAGGEKSPPA
jgi:hypothetical protein